MIFIFTTVPGIEDIVINELKERLLSKFESAVIINPGVLMAVISDADLETLRRMGTVENIIMVLDTGLVGKDLDSVRECIKKLRLNMLFNYYTPNITLGVNVDRSGEHEYRSPEVASLIGDFVSEYILTNMGVRPVFNLDNPDLMLHVIIAQDKCILGINVTKSSLRNRPYRRYIHPASINPILANAMVRILNPGTYTRICDVTCGSGTIIIEGALNNKDNAYLCVDIDERHILGALENIKASGVYDKVDLLVTDSTMPGLRDKACEYVVFNPPFGIRMEPLQGIKTFYRNIFTSLRRLLKDSASIVLITIRRSLVRSLAKEFGFEIISERVVEQGGIYSSIFKLIKRSTGP